MEDSLQRNNRIEYLDALKGMCMILVVYCHGVLLPYDSVIGNIVMCLAWVAVPCFVMSSGAVMHQRKTFNWNNYLKKLLLIYIGIVAWRLIYFCAYYVVGKVNLSLLSFCSYLFLINDVSQIDTGVMWYMKSFMELMIMYPITYILFNASKLGRQVLVFIAVLLFAVGILEPSVNNFAANVLGYDINHLVENIVGMVSINTNVMMLFYFIMGALLYEYRDKIKQLLKGRVVLISCICLGVGLIAQVFVKYIQAGTFNWNNEYITMGYSHISVLLMAEGLYLLFQEIHITFVEKVLAKFIGRYTLGIYYLHYIILTMFSWTIWHDMCLDNYFCGMNVVKTIILVAACSIVVIIIRKIPYIRSIV